MNKLVVGGVVVLLGVVGVRDCAGCSSGPPPRPALIWDGKQFVAAWREFGSIYVNDRRVLSERDLGDPTIAPTGAGYLLVTTREDERERDRRVELALPLDRATRPSRRPQPQYGLTSADQSCASQLAPGGIATSGYISRPREGEAYFLSVHTYDDRGEHRNGKMWITLDPPIACTLASRGDELVFAIRYETSISIHFHDLRDMHELANLELSVGDPDDGSLAIAPAPDGRWAVLYRGADAAMRVATFDRNGLRRTTPLPFAIEARTADLGGNDRGLFVTWRDGRTLHVRGVDGGTDRTARAPANSSATRASGAGTTCAVAVRGREVVVKTFASCP